MKDIFISFSSKNENEAFRICGVLEKRGIECFISTRDLIAGEEYAMQLLQNMDNVQAVVLLLSRYSNESPHVLRELEYAVAHKIPIIVYVLEEVTLNKSLEYFLMTHQWINVSDNRDERLIEGIRYLLKKPEGHADVITEKEPLSEKTAKKSKRALLLIVATLLLISIIITILFINRKHADEGQDIPATPIVEKHEYALGESVSFGRYLDEPITWRVIKINDDNTMVLISDEILCLKAFDAPESGMFGFYNNINYISNEYKDVADEEILIMSRGNNDWAKSNIRTWLNSEDEQVLYTDQAPTIDAVGVNFYKGEAGFLSNFSNEEKAAIVVTYNKTKSNSYSNNVVNGEVITEDRAFLLSSSELDWLRDANLNIYAKQSDACIANDAKPGTHNDLSVSFGIDSYYWRLRDNSGDRICASYIVDTEFETQHIIEEVAAGVSDFGIRPAITVDMSSDAIHPLDRY